ncbi:MULTISPECIES: GNAT family N-acetyltransferase [Streptococcus]|jgi:protein phnO|uniref:GNAT family N-acetyltransferase n=1 Tax=Streptococcus TaxID=1301 RepID=UPI001021C2CB|nr:MULTISPECIES: GNAT family N-acetyltransferase [unclassified Streptococcus]MTQ41498.1 GNAT family N-acetyltransferase [Streptococcus sp. BIOML-A1]RYS60762.1 GNAT family N-acetyltransferase [Streptococcus sp. bf_0095]
MLRNLLLTDVEALSRINTQALGYSFSIEKTAQQLVKLIQDSHHFFIGFEDVKSHQLLGYVHAEVYQSLYSEPGFNVLALAVLPDQQGKGIGKILLQGLEEEAKRRGYAFIRLNSADYRTEAHAFYEHVGYSSDKLQKRFIKFF